jgi:glutaredoxin-like protein NrdH
MTIEHVAGEKMAEVMLYALSTCVWCQKTRALLEELGVDYSYEYVDLLAGDEKQQAMRAVERWNPRFSFPTVVINDKAIIGFKENEIREALKK